MANDEEGESQTGTGEKMAISDSETITGTIQNATETNEPNSNTPAPFVNGTSQPAAISPLTDIEKQVVPGGNESTSQEVAGDISAPDAPPPTSSASLAAPSDEKEKQSSPQREEPKESNNDALAPSSTSLTTLEVPITGTAPTNSTTTFPPKEEFARDSPPPPPRKRKLCGVCNENDGKYNCIRCSLPFCSISCLNTHKPTHPSLPPKPSSLPPKPSPPIQNGTARPGTVAGSQAPNPFSVLDDSPQLKQLFKNFPNLPKVLNDIHTSTLKTLDNVPPPIQSPTPPPPRNRNHHHSKRDRNNHHQTQNQNGGKRKKEEPWTYDRGMQKGRDTLHTLKNTDSDDGEAIRQYCDLVLLLLGSEEERAERAAELVQQEEMKESVALIKRLSEIESQR